MSFILSHPRKPLLAGALSMALACFGLAACGSSGSSSTTSTTNAANTSSSSTTTTAANTSSTNTSSTTTSSTSTGSTSTSPAPGGGPGGRFAALRTCLQQNGVTLPQRPAGQPRTPGAGGGFLGGGAGARLPKGVTRAQLQAALKKCGAARPFGQPGGRARFDNPTFHAALTAFAACMRQNGIALPTPNTSGTGPVFQTKGIDTASAQFKAARTKCQSKLSGAFARPGAARPQN